LISQGEGLGFGLDYGFGIGAAVAGAVALGYLARWAGRRFGALDRPGHLKEHPEPVPLLGGVAVGGAIVLGMLATSDWPAAAVSAAILGAFLLGLADDLAVLSPWLRLAVQAGLGILLGAGLRAGGVPGGTAAEWAGAALLLVVGVNSVNMVDGLDGLAPGLTIMSALGIAVVASRGDHSYGFPLILTGAAFGFLWHNAPRAALFLGDNGSCLIGAALAACVLSAGTTGQTLAGAVTCLGLFLLDLALSVLRRIALRTPLTRGDRSHLYDQLIARGMSPAGCLLLCLAVQTVFAAAGITISSMATAQGALLEAAAVWIVALVFLVAAGFVRRPAAA
jgi:UDP-GlcNAc:undecaprenyl-phosphate GlcNAc-1-phosphate transferase